MFATERFHQYTYGRQVLVESDRKPSETIFTKPLVSAPKRLLKMILRLQRYVLDVRYWKGKELDLADILNLHFPKLTETTGEHREHVFLTISALVEGLEVEQDVQEIKHLLVSEHEVEMFRSETKNDDVLQAVISVVQSRWPADKRKLTPAVAVIAATDWWSRIDHSSGVTDS